MAWKKASVMGGRVRFKPLILSGFLVATSVLGGGSASLILAASPAVAQEAAALSISGLIPLTNNEAVKLSVDELSKIAPTSFITTTIWTEGPQEFEGASLKGLLNHLGVTSGTLVARAVNDYSVNIPVADIEIGGPMIAYRRNGKTMPVRDKGPFWIVYPYDLEDKYRSEEVFSRSIWQLTSIEITE